MTTSFGRAGRAPGLATVFFGVWPQTIAAVDSTASKHAIALRVVRRIDFLTSALVAHILFCESLARSRAAHATTQAFLLSVLRSAQWSCASITRMRLLEKSQLMSAAEIDRTLQRLAHQIVEKSGGTRHLALIGIRRRGVPLAQRIALAMRGIDGVEVPVGTLDITLYRDDLSKVAPQAVLQSSHISFPVDSLDLVLVDDVLYTGRTVRAAMNGLFDLGRPKRVSLCVLVDRGHREMPIEAQYVGRDIQTSDTEIIEVRLREIDNEERVILVDRVES